MLRDVDDVPQRRALAWSNMFVHPDEDPRSDESFEDEREILVDCLRDQRLTLELKCAGLDAGQPGRRLDGAVADPEVVEEAWRSWRAQVEYADRFVAEHDLGVGRPQVTSGPRVRVMNRLCGSGR
jgi:hypothetical protein